MDTGDTGRFIQRHRGVEIFLKCYPFYNINIFDFKSRYPLTLANKYFGQIANKLQKKT